MNRAKTALISCILIAAVACAAVQGFSVFTDPQIPDRGILFYEFIDRGVDWLREWNESDPNRGNGWTETVMQNLLRTLNDPYSQYMDEDEYDRFLTDIVGTFGGIGVVIAQEGEYTRVVRLTEPSSAKEAGIRAGDKIIRVDGENAVGSGLDNVGDRLKGDAGSRVQVDVLREDGQEYSYTITREVIRVNTVESSMIDDQFGYIYISMFNEHTASNLADALNSMYYKGIKGLVLDLRDNPGGLLDQGIEVAKMLVPEGPVVHVVDRTGYKETYYSTGRGLPWPLAVLVNGGTASAAEIVAGAVKDSRAGFLVGTPTYGKGSVQSVFNFGIGGVKITMANYFTPDEYPIEGEGIVPNTITYQRISGDNARIETVPALYPLQLGDEGTAVARMQKILTHLGFETGSVEGTFDAGTQKALVRFQEAVGLPATGIGDTETLARLNYALLSHSMPFEGDAQLRKAVALLKELNLH